MRREAMFPSLMAFFKEEGIMSAREYRKHASAPYHIRKVILTYGSYLRALHVMKKYFAKKASQGRNVPSIIRITSASTMEHTETP